MVKNEFRQILHPNAVLPLKIDGVNVPMQKRVTLLAFLTTYLIICLIISFTMIAMGIDNTNAITITLSCVGNVRPNLGNGNWSHHVVERTARSGQVVLFADDAHRPSGELQRSGNLHTSLLEEELGGEETGKRSETEIQGIKRAFLLIRCSCKG